MRASLNRAAAGPIEEVRVASGDLAGARLSLDLKAEKSLWLGTYEPELQRAIRTFAGQGMTAYDIGANLGYTAMLLARAVGPKGRVFAFEPEPRNLSRLARHVARNPEGRRVTVIAAAVGARSGRGRLQIHRSTSMGKLVGAPGRAELYTSVVSVPLMTLDRFVARGGPPPHIVKIDVEGAEAHVLAGMRRILERDRPLLLIEMHGPAAAGATRRTLRENGYCLLRMRGRYPDETAEADHPWKDYVVALPRARGQVRRR
jgi:FkbM family methyltransferase